jgi:hypothetical protein
MNIGRVNDDSDADQAGQAPSGDETQNRVSLSRRHSDGQDGQENDGTVRVFGALSHSASAIEQKPKRCLHFQPETLAPTCYAAALLALVIYMMVQFITNSTCGYWSTWLLGSSIAWILIVAFILKLVFFPAEFGANHEIVVCPLFCCVNTFVFAWLISGSVWAWNSAFSPGPNAAMSCFSIQPVLQNVIIVSWVFEAFAMLIFFRLVCNIIKTMG